MRVPGIYHPRDLPELGVDPRARRRLLAEGRLHRCGPWFVTDEADPLVAAVLRTGARPTCLDAAVLHQLWVPPHPGVHVRRPRTGPETPKAPLWRGTPLISRRGKSVATESGQLRAISPGSLQPYVFHAPVHSAWTFRDPVPEVPDLLSDAARCLPVPLAAIVWESALERRLISEAEAQHLAAGLPADLARQLRRVRSDAGSGTETRVRWWLESMHVAVRSQVQVCRGIRVDLLVGSSWVIECDSRAHHTGDEQYHRDRWRDLTLRAMGYTVTRLTWEQVFLHWEATTAVLLQILRRREHRRLPVK